MSNFVVEDGVPIPKRRKNGLIEVMGKMQVGQSILLSQEQYRSFNTFRGRFKPIKFTARKEGSGYRAWRVE